MASLRRKCMKSEVNKNVNFCTMPKNGPATSYAWLSDSNISTKIQIQFFCMIKRSFSIPFKRKLAKHAPYHIVHFSVLRHSRLKHWVKHLPLYNIRNCFVEARCTKSAADTLNTSLCFKEANVSLGAWAYNVWELPEPPSTELHRMSKKNNWYAPYRKLAKPAQYPIVHCIAFILFTSAWNETQYLFTYLFNYSTAQVD